jgi:hypothetical protein
MGHQIAFVLIDQPAIVEMQVLAQAVHARYPGLPVEAVAASAKHGQGAAQSPLIGCGDEFVAVMNIPVPLPRDMGEEVWARAATTWPEALAVRMGHRAHIVVGTLGKVQSPLPEARVVTAVVGGLLDTIPGCLAVMWAERVVRPAALWKDQSRRAYAAYPDYPILLWLDIAPIRTASGIEAVTIGLSSFVDREIEFEVGRLQPADVLNKVAGLAVYLIEHGQALKDGDTFGGSERERIKVRHANSARLGGVPVLRVDTTELDTGRDQ